MRIRNMAAMNVLGKLLLLFVSFVFSVLVAELLARVVFDPVDYLNPTLVDDKFLNHRIEGHTGGHDEWGFRNARRPETADLVCRLLLEKKKTESVPHERVKELVDTH